MADLRTNYLGFDLTCPLVAAASPLTGSMDGIRGLEDAGAGAITLPSLFEEQIAHEQLGTQPLRAAGAEVVGVWSPADFPAVPGTADSISGHSGAPSYAYGGNAEAYLEHVRSAKAAVDVPVIASMNGTTTGAWLEYAKHIQDAGADALELNIYYIAADPAVTGADVEHRFSSVVRAVKETISIPLVVKIPPFFSSPAHTIHDLSNAGATAVVLFNRFVQPDIDLDSLSVQPTLTLSSSDELLLTLRWMAILYGKVDCHLAATTGAHTAKDVLKLLLAGANVVTMASALVLHGAEHLARLRAHLDDWLDQNKYQSVDQLRGSLSQVNSPDPVAYERASYMKALLNYGTPPVKPA